MDWTPFFPPGARVMALPGWRNPRLYLPARGPLERWEKSDLFPASRLSARLYRFMLRLGAAAKMAETRTVHSNGWPLWEFARDALPGLTTVVALVGTPSPIQEITVQLWDERGRVAGYLKYAEKEAARRRLRHEWFMLHNLPDRIGPKPIKFGLLGRGEALLQSALPGKKLPVSLPPARDLIDFLDSLVVLPPMPLAEHPWVRSMRDHGPLDLEASFEPLAGRSWPVVVQHGDFVPWNLLRTPDGRLGTIDWEHGTPEGFPHLDLAHYILQVLALIYRWPPSRAVRYATEQMARQSSLALNGAEAQAVTRLAAYDAYWKYLEEGHPETGLQAWRRAIWETGG